MESLNGHFNNPWEKEGNWFFFEIRDVNGGERSKHTPHSRSGLSSCRQRSTSIEGGEPRT